MRAVCEEYRLAVPDIRLPLVQKARSAVNALQGVDKTIQFPAAESLGDPLFMLDERGLGLGEHLTAFGGDVKFLPPTILRRTFAGDEAPFFQPVDNRHHRSAVHAKFGRQSDLRYTAVCADKPEDTRLFLGQVQLCHRRHEVSGYRDIGHQ